MKAGTTELMKFKRLLRRLRISRPQCVGHLELLWYGTSRNCPAGDIGRFTNEEIAVLVDWEGDPDELVNSLVETGWLDESPTHRLVVHDWADHAPTWLKGVVAKKGGFVTANGHEPKVADPESVTNPASVADPESATQGGSLPYLTLPNHTSPNLSSTSSSPVGDQVEEVEEDFINRISERCRERMKRCCPIAIETALRDGLRNGCSRDQLVERCWWIWKHIDEWPNEHRGGVVFEGLSKARPSTKPDEGWPYIENRRRP
jgi:hypothetical protein